MRGFGSPFFFPLLMHPTRNFLLLIFKSQIRKFLKILHNSVSKQSQRFLLYFYYVQILIRTFYAIFVRRKSILYFRTFGSFKSSNHKKDSVRKSQIRKVSHVRKLRKSNKLFNGTYLRTTHLWQLISSLFCLFFNIWHFAKRRMWSAVYSQIRIY
jgi:hypothetical protein